MLPTFLIFLIILSILVFIHEFGHFLVAKKMGVGVDEFGFGYPPRLFGFKIGETLYSVNLLPFGGFVKLYGEEEAEQKSKYNLKTAFFAKSKKARAAVILAGVIGNFLLGVLCFSYVYSKIGIPEKQDKIRIIEVKENSPASQVGFLADDQIVKVGDKEVKSLEEFVNSVKENAGKETDFTVKRKEEILILKATPRENPPAGQGALGISISPIQMVFYPKWQMPFRGAWVGLQEAISWGLMIVGGIFLTIKQLFAGVAPDVTGPVGIFQITSAVAKQGFLNTIQFVGVLSVNLAVLNIFPFPALDGGRLAFIFLEKVIGKKLKPKIEQTINLAGMMLLIFLMLLVTVNDLVRLFKNSGILARILSFLPFLK